MDNPTPIVDAPRKSAQRFRRTRIAVSVFFGLLTVALCVLWARSYWRGDNFSAASSATCRMICTVRGSVTLNSQQNAAGLWEPGLSLKSSPIGDRRWSNIGARNVHFNWASSPDGLQLIFPLWLPILVGGLLAAVPWVHRRFSLRTMLIATTLVAVVLGLSVWLVR